MTCEFFKQTCRLIDDKHCKRIMNRENFINFISGIENVLSLGWHFVWYLECRVNNMCGQVLIGDFLRFLLNIKHKGIL